MALSQEIEDFTIFMMIRSKSLRLQRIRLDREIANEEREIKILQEQKTNWYIGAAQEVAAVFEA